MTLFIIFTALTILNVIIGTIKSIVTVNGGKVAAAAINALAYGVNTVAIIYTVCDLPLFAKVAVVAATNFIGVFIVKWVEEKSRKEKLWKLECTVMGAETDKLHNALNACDIPHSYIQDIGKYSIFNIFCATKDDTKMAKDLLRKYNAKYFVTEGKDIG